MKKEVRFLATLLLLTIGVSNTNAASVKQRNTLYGVNLAGAEFAAPILPGINGINYLWPDIQDLTMFNQAGANSFRIPFLWERIQPILNKPLDSSEVLRLDALATYASIKKIYLILDLHNYGMYNQQLLGSQSVSGSAFANLWSRLAAHYKNNPYVIFGLMNEPHVQKADEWALLAQKGINAIRQEGANQLILVPGTNWTGAYSWFSKNGTLSNAEALKTIKDPANNIAFEVHQYLDTDSSGTHSDCVSATIGIERLTQMTQWLKDNKQKGFLGEFGAAQNKMCLSALDNMMKYLATNSSTWYGWTYWGASKWFGSYMFNVYPPDPQKYSQLPILQKAMSGY